MCCCCCQFHHHPWQRYTLSISYDPLPPLQVSLIGSSISRHLQWSMPFFSLKFFLWSVAASGTSPQTKKNQASCELSEIDTNALQAQPISCLLICNELQTTYKKTQAAPWMISRRRWASWWSQFQELLQWKAQSKWETSMQADHADLNCILLLLQPKQILSSTWNKHGLPLLLPRFKCWKPWWWSVGIFLLIIHMFLIWWPTWALEKPFFFTNMFDNNKFQIPKTLLSILFSFSLVWTSVCFICMWKISWYKNL